MYEVGLRVQDFEPHAFFSGFSVLVLGFRVQGSGLV